MFVAVTGAAGHLGANVVRELIDNGCRVRTLDLPCTNLAALQGLSVDHRAVDVLDSSALLDAFEDVEAVIHLAAVISINGDPDGQVMQVNVTGTRNVTEACLAKNVKKLIHVSSIHAFKTENNSARVDESSPKADNKSFMYDYSKALGEQEVLAAANKGLNVSILNPTGLLGPYDFTHSYSGQMLRELFTGKLPALLDGGFDWTDTRDVAQTIRSAITNGQNGGQYLLSGSWVSFRTLANLCEEASGVAAPRFVLPMPLAFAILPFFTIASRVSGKQTRFTYESLKIVQNGSQHCNSAKARDELGHNSRPLSETVADTYDWNRKQKFI